MKLFFSLFERKKEEKEKNEKKKQRRSAKTLASAFIMLILINSTFSAGYAAAWGPDWDWGSKFITHWKEGFATAIAGAAVGFMVGGPIGAAVGFFGGYLVGAEGIGSLVDYFSAPGGSSQGETGGTSPDRYASENSTTSDTDNPDAQKIVNDANQKAYQAIQELTAKLRSDFIQYGSSSGTGIVTVTIYGPSSIYGFSAFPVQARLHVADTPIPFDVVHLEEVHIYVIDKDGHKYWERKWIYTANGSAGSEGIAPGQNVVYTTVLKGPDPLLYKIKQAVETGQIDRQLYDEIWNTTTSEFEVHVWVKGFQEAWKGYPNATDSASCQKVDGKWYDGMCYVFDKKIDFQVDAESTSAWKHVTGVADVAEVTDGMYGSLPVKFLMSDTPSKWAIYQSRYAGGLSDFVVVTAASPVHVLNSTANYKFIIAPNPDYFNPATPKIRDDFRFVILRVIEGGRMELADQVNGNLGDLTEPKEMPLTAHYTDAPGTLDYHALGLAYVNIIRDDNVSIPVWLVAEPQISVLQNLYVAVADQEVQKLINSFKKNDTAKIKGTVDALISGLQQKLDDTEQLLQKAQSLKNKDAEEYAEKAIAEYKAAINDLKKLEQVDDYQTFLNYLNAAKKHEQAGDYYRNAARKALDGDLEQAKIDAQKGDELSKLASEYEPGFNLAGLLGGKEGMKALLALVIAIVLAGAVWLMMGNKQLAVLVFIVSLVILLLAFYKPNLSSLTSLKPPKIG